MYDPIFGMVRLNINDLTDEAKEEMLSKKGCCYYCIIRPICSTGCDKFMVEFKSCFSTMKNPIFDFRKRNEEL